jgi:hypothetical protein
MPDLAEGTVLRAQGAVGDFAQAVVVADVTMLRSSSVASRRATGRCRDRVRSRVGRGFVGEQDGGIVGEAGDGGACFSPPESWSGRKPSRAAAEVDGKRRRVTDGAGNLQASSTFAGADAERLKSWKMNPGGWLVAQVGDVRGSGEVDTVDDDRAAGGAEHGPEHQEQGGLAAAGGAHHETTSPAARRGLCR